MTHLVKLVSFALSFISVVNLKPVDTNDAINFTIKNFGINTTGSMKGLKGNIKWDAENISNSSFNVSADVSTINTGIDSRDSHLQKEEYFNVDKYPNISFTSTTISAGNVTGNLTIKGVTKSINFPFTVKSLGAGYLFEGSFTINRRDFNVGGKSMVLSDNVIVNLKLTATP